METASARSKFVVYFSNKDHLPNPYFTFKQFSIQQDRCAMKVTTDACLFGALVARECVLQQRPAMALDIGTGTGLLSLMIAQKLPSLQIDAAEIEQDAAEQAKENFSASPWANRIGLSAEDILSYEPGKKYDLIFSNPPFYENELASPDPLRKLAHHNAELPLAALFSKISQLLDDKGECWLLLPYKRKEEIRPLLEKNGFRMKRLFLIRNSADHDYFRIILCMGHEGGSSQETPIEEISIFEEKNTYSYEFTELLKDYYLKL